jgi:hypothetical protein
MSETMNIAPAANAMPQAYIQEQVDALLAQLRETEAQLDQTKTKLDQTKTKLDQTKTKLDQTKTKLDQTKTKLDQTKMMSGVNYCRLKLFSYNTSQSSLHLDTSAPIVRLVQLDVKTIPLPDTFWVAPVFHQPSRSARNEAVVEVKFLKLLESVVNGLKCAYLIPQQTLLDFDNQVNLLDARSDIGVVLGPNEFVTSPIEIKKHDESEVNDVFESESYGIGQLFNQLALVALSHFGCCYGLISTGNTIRIIANQDMTADLTALRSRWADSAAVDPNTASEDQSEELTDTAAGKLPGSDRGERKVKRGRIWPRGCWADQVRGESKAKNQRIRLRGSCKNRVREKSVVTPLVNRFEEF